MSDIQYSPKHTQTGKGQTFETESEDLPQTSQQTPTTPFRRTQFPSIISFTIVIHNRRFTHKLAPPTSIILRLPPPRNHHPTIRVSLSSLAAESGNRTEESWGAKYRTGKHLCDMCGSEEGVIRV